MKLTGDEKGIAILKEMHSTNNDYLKFLLQEAKTVFEKYASFKSVDGKESFKLHFDPTSNEYKVEKL